MILSQAEADEELTKVEAAEVEDAGLQAFAYLRLGDEDFERLTYALAKVSAPGGVPRCWDSAALMVRGADAGRDVLLTKEGRAVGVVQCKRLESQMALPAVFREIAKLILFAAVNDDLGFETKLIYFLTVARDPAGTVVDFFARYNELRSLKEEEIRAAAREVRDSYTTINKFSDMEAEQRVLNAMRGLKLHLLRPTDLNEWLGREPSVSQRFFRQRLVVDNEAIEKFRTDVFAQFAALKGQVSALAPVTDADLAVMKEWIEEAPETHRLNVGVAMLFGFPREMFVGRSNLEERVGRLVALQQEINQDYIDWVFAKVRDKAQEINESPEGASTALFARQLPLQFLSLVAKECLAEALSGSVMNEIINKLAGNLQFDTDDARLAHVRGELYAQGKRYLDGDFSELVGDEALIAQKRALIDTLMENVRHSDDVESALDNAIALLKPKLLAAAEALRALCKHKTTIVLTGSRGIDTEAAINRLIDTARALDEAQASDGQRRPSPGDA